MEDTAARLARIEDIEAIRLLLTDYGRTLDGRDAEGFAALFAVEGEWIATGHFVEGRDAIRAMIERLLANSKAEGQSHLLTNYTIEVDQGMATAMSRFYVVAPAADGAPRIRLSGRYDDLLVREDGKWRFLRRTLTHELRLPAAAPAAVMDLPRIRRVVTGHDPAGRSVVLADAPAIRHGPIGTRGMMVHDIWETPALPATLEAAEPDPVDIPLHFGIPETGIRVRIADMPPSEEGDEPFMHRTEAIDYVFVLEGEITMLMEEDAEPVILRKGDSLVQRGALHAWVNRSGAPCRILFVIAAARLSETLKQTLGITEVTWDSQNGGVR
jgi:uncharacterized protein (TIGR02246 family)